MPYVQLGDTNPLTGLPLLPGQILVRGPALTKRVTVVTLGNPASWPRWIKMDDTAQPYDDGAIPGGTWSGPQSLPDLETTVPQSFPWVLLGLFALGLWALSKGSRGGQSWE